MIARFDGVEIANLDDALSGRVIEGNSDVAELAKIWETSEKRLCPPENH
jgi:hypothetical protein